MNKPNIYFDVQEISRLLVGTQICIAIILIDVPYIFYYLYYNQQMYN